MEQKSYYPLWRPVDFSKGNPNRYHAIGPEAAERAIFAVRQALPAGMTLKAADTISVGPLVRQDLEAKIYELFVKVFPFYDMVQKTPANGLVHAFNQQVAYTSGSTPPTISELGTVTDDANQYIRATQNIAIFAGRRGISLKAQYAVQAGGMAYDPETREIAGGLLKIRRDVQAEMFRYNSTIPGTIATDPNGQYDANGFDGLRYTINNLSPAGNTFTAVPATGPTTPYPPQPITIAVREAANAILDAGGFPDMVLSGITAKELLIQEQLPQVRYETMEVVPGLRVQRIAAGESELPIITVPGDANGIGTIVTGGHTYREIFVVDSSTLEWVYLGGPTPTVLEIPVGVDGTLRKLYIPFMMGGLVCAAPIFLARVLVQVA